jgi:carbon storage regulator CsrA
MLVLSRMRNENLIITVPPSKKTRKIRIWIVDVRGDKVRIGGEADKDVVIDREEIHAIKQDGRV